MGIDEIVAKIRTKSREGWAAFIREQWTFLRIWVQEHGEIAAGAGLLGGVLLVLAFRFIIGLLLLVAIACFVIWNIAVPEAQQLPKEEKPDEGANR